MLLFTVTKLQKEILLSYCQYPHNLRLDPNQNQQKFSRSFFASHYDENQYEFPAPSQLLKITSKIWFIASTPVELVRNSYYSNEVQMIYKRIPLSKT